MIITDKQALEIITRRINSRKILKNENELLQIVKLLMNQYSFVNNQTYPRPSHPNPNKRKDAYFTLIAIVLSLRTTLENEVKAVDAFCNKYTNIHEVANANIKDLAELIKCAGMPQKKAQTIINISNFIINNYNGDINNINNGTLEQIKNKLFEIPGLGEKSVDCMLELAFDLPSIVVDINVFRVISRLYFNNEMNFNNNKDILKIKNFLETNLIKDYQIYQIVHTIILLHGKFICKSSPNCDNCIINNNCNFYKKNNNYEQLKIF